MMRPSSSAERLAVLHGIIKELNRHVATADLAKLHLVVAESARRLVDAEVAVVLSWDGSRRLLIVEATASDLPAGSHPTAAELAPCASPAFASGTTVVLEDLEEQPRAAPLARRLGLGPMAALPIVRAGDGPPLGALFVALTRGQEPLNGDEILGLELLAVHAGMALTHAESAAAAARRFARVEQLTVSLRGLAEVHERGALLERGLDCAIGVLGADRAAIYLTNSREELSFCATRGLSRAYLEIAAQKYRSSVGALVPLAQAPVYVADMQTDPRTRVLHDLAAQEGIRTVLFVPMLRAGRLLGALALYHDMVWRYEPEDLAQARALADELAVALVNAATLESAQRELTRVRSLGRLAQHLLEGHGLRRGLQLLVEDGAASAAWLWNSSMQLLGEAGSGDGGPEDLAASGRAALDGGRPVTRVSSWGTVAAAPLRHGGHIHGVVAVGERRWVRPEPFPPSIHLEVSGEVDVAEQLALAAGAAISLSVAMAILPGREARARSGGKP